MRLTGQMPRLARGVEVSPALVCLTLRVVDALDARKGHLGCDLVAELLLCAPVHLNHVLRLWFAVLHDAYLYGNPVTSLYLGSYPRIE